MLNQLI